MDFLRQAGLFHGVFYGQHLVPSSETNEISVGQGWEMERLLCKVQGNRYKVCGGSCGGRIENIDMEMGEQDLQSQTKEYVSYSLRYEE